MPVQRTGWKPVPPKAAGPENRPANAMMVWDVPRDPGYLFITFSILPNRFIHQAFPPPKIKGVLRQYP